VENKVCHFGNVKQRRVTMADVAAKVGVSRIAVSMALRDHHRISLELRKKVQRVAREMGFVPDPFLSALAAHRQQRVTAKEHGVLAWVNHWKDPKQLRQFKEFELYWRGASEAAVKFGYRVDEIRWELDCSPKRLEKILLARGIEGVLIPPHRELVDWDDFDWNKFSVVRFGMSVPSPDSNVVTSDTYRTTVMAISKMREYGYRRIGLTVNGEFNQRVGGNLLSGLFYAQNLLALKPALPPLLTFLKSRTEDEMDRQKDALSVWLKQHKPDALLISDIEVPGMLHELGYRIPQDIAVAGTTVLDIPRVDAGVDQHPEAIGRTAVETLLKQMNVNERGEPRFPVRVLVEGRWKDGKSLPQKR
jgi:DNA-binding LacI/PurR family transcriptional regulator